MQTGLQAMQKLMPGRHPARAQSAPANAAPRALGAPRSPAPRDAARNQRLWRACQDFESVLLAQLVRTMYRASLRTALLDVGIAGEALFDYFAYELARSLAPTWKLGLAEQLYRQLSTASGAAARQSLPQPSTPSQSKPPAAGG